MTTTAHVPAQYTCPVCLCAYKQYQTGYMYLADLLCSKACLEKYIEVRTMEVVIMPEEGSK